MRWLPSERLEFETPFPPEEVVERLRRLTRAPRLLGTWFARGSILFEGIADGNHFEVRPIAGFRDRALVAYVVGDVRGDAAGSTISVTIRPRVPDMVLVILELTLISGLCILAGVEAVKHSGTSWELAAFTAVLACAHVNMLRAYRATAARARGALRDLVGAELRASGA